MVASTASATRHAIAWPEPLSETAYAEVRDAYLDRLFATGQIRGAYQMGGIGAPGLSDLDLILVCRDPLTSDLNEVADIRSLGPRARYVLMHSQFFVNEEVFRHHRALFWGSDLRHVRGETFDVWQPPAAEAAVHQLVFHVEMMLRRLADFERMRAGGDAIAVRPLVAALHGICFNIEYARRHADVADLEDYVIAVRHLRATWFDLSRDQADAWVASLLDRAVEVLTALFQRLRAPVADLHTGARGVRDGRVRILEIQETQRFGPWEPSVSMRPNPFRLAVPRALRDQRALRPHLAPVVEVRVPSEYFVFPAELALALRALGARELARRVHGELNGCVASELRGAMRRRADVAMALLEFIAANRLRRLAYLMSSNWLRPYPWQYRMKARLLAAARVG